jgi:hypothetical protein
MCRSTGWTWWHQATESSTGAAASPRATSAHTAQPASEREVKSLSDFVASLRSLLRGPISADSPLHRTTMDPQIVSCCPRTAKFRRDPKPRQTPKEREREKSLRCDRALNHRSRLSSDLRSMIVRSVR